MKTTTINTLATTYKLTFDKVKSALEAAGVTPVSELPIGNRSYHLYDADAVVPVMAAAAAEAAAKRQRAHDKRMQKLRKTIGAPPAADDSRLQVIESKIDALIELVKRMEHNALVVHEEFN